MIQAKNFDVVINCIGAIKQKGYSQVDMFAINSILPKLLARKVENTDTKILHFTTDCVYKGETEALLHENREHDALDVYGLSKSLGEIQQENVFNIRTSFVGPEQGSNYSLLSWFTSQERNAVINGFSRQYWNGIGSLQYSKIIEAIILRSNFSFPNNIHLLPRDYVSKYELLLLFRDYFDREDVKIVRNDHEDFIYRVLSTSYPEINASLWRLAGYTEIPTIEFMVRELSDAVSS